MHCIMDYMLSVQEDIVCNVKKRRKEFGLSQQELAKRSGVSYGAIKRFETKGDISLCSIIKIAFVLNCENDFNQLFSKKNYSSIDEVINDR